MYIYILSERFIDLDQQQRELWTVGFYKPDGSFEAESDHSEKGAAADRCAWLNGGAPWEVLESVKNAAGWYLEIAQSP
jgi:hypothetical protein